MPPSVSCAGLTTVLDGRAVLYRVDLEIPAGRRTVVLGPRGCGKSTLVRHLVGLDPPGAGEVRIGGEPLWNVDLHARNRARQDLAVMLSGKSTFASQLSSMTVYDNIAYQLRLMSLSEHEIDRRVTECLDELDLLDVADRLPEQIPDRARRRLALARALVPDVSLLILDGPETVFDTGQVEQATRVTMAAQERSGATLIVATSNVELARRMAQHVVILCDGRVLAQGDPTALLDTAADLDRRCRELDTGVPADLEVAREMIERADRARRQQPRGRYYLTVLLTVVVLVTVISLYYLLLATL